MKTIHDKINNIINEDILDIRDLSLGYLRYEVLRKLNVQQYYELKKRNLKGENFDDMVDELIMKEYNAKAGE